MSLLRTTVPMLALVLAGAGQLDAQIPIRNGATQSNAPRLMVATPYTDRAADSAAAVTIGNALRTRFERVVGTSYSVLKRDQMNKALGEFSYPADAVLTRESARRLSMALQARTMLFAEVGREGGRLKVRARLAGLSDDAGTTITVFQAQGQSLQQFGEAVAVAFQGAVRAQPDAKACIDQTSSDVRKADESAKKALRAYPAHGLAHMCLAGLAKKRSETDTLYPKELDAAVRGDSLSLVALAQLADWYNAKADTAAVILKYQQMIEADPTNLALIEQASKIFRSMGRPDAAEQVADRGIALDSLNTVMWELRSSACVFQQKYSCAVTSLEQVVLIDSTKADSNFIFRIAVTAGSAAADSVELKAKFLKWAQLGAARYPTNKNLVGQLLQAYSVNGMTDSVLVVTDRVFALDSTDVSPILTAIEILLGQKRWADAARYGALVQAKGDDQQKVAVAANFANVSRTLLTVQPVDPEAAYGLLKIAIPAAGTDARIAPTANFLMGFAALQTAFKYDGQAEQSKSCELARRLDGLIDESKSGFTIGRAVNPAPADNQLNGPVKTFKARFTSMITAYCR
jgi:tetratricopeptide (TPR) repeat protein